MQNLILIGMPGSGKSTVGVLAAKALQMDFQDTDLIFQRQIGVPLQALVDQLGTRGFCQKEEACVAALSFTRSVVATGGSVALEETAMQALQKQGRIVFLRASYETIRARLGNIKTRGISMEKGQTLQSLYEERQPFYERWADAILDVDGQTLEETVEGLVALATGVEGEGR